MKIAILLIMLIAILALLKRSRAIQQFKQESIYLEFFIKNCIVCRATELYIRNSITKLRNSLFIDKERIRKIELRYKRKFEKI